MADELLFDFVEFVVEYLVVENLVVDVVHAEEEVEVVALQIVKQFGFVEAVAFAGEPFDLHAVDGMVEFLL